MLEAAYVLPLVLGVMLFIVEVVAFAMNSFVANDVLTDVHTSILSEVSEVANMTDASTVPVDFYVECSGGRVVFKGTASEKLAINVNAAFDLKGVIVSNPIASVNTPVDVAGFDVYVLEFSGSVAPVVMPGFLEGLLPINVQTVISIKDTCS